MERGFLGDRRSVWLWRALLLGAALTLALFVAGCGGDASGPTAGGGIGGSGTGQPIAGGGVGGTGTGTVTAVGTGYRTMDSSDDDGENSGAVASIQLNGTRTFTVTEQTQFLIDGVPVDATTFLTEGKGLVVRVDVGGDVNADFTRGTALRVEGRHLLRGPVTSVSPLRVMGQEVVTTPSTVLAGGLGTGYGSAGASADWQAQLAALFKAGPVYLAVSGYVSAPGQVQATRLARVSKPPAEWKLTGEAGSSVQVGFTVGAQTVRLTAGAGNCGPAVRAGNMVDVRFAPDFAYLLSIAGGTPGVLTATSVMCINTALEIPDGVHTSWLAVGMEGIVSDASGGDGYSFLVDGQPVQVTDETTYRSGSEDSIVVGARVQVDGLLDLTTGVLTANALEFFGGEVRIEARLTDATESLLQMIGISVWRTPTTAGDLELFGEPLSDRLVRVEGIQGLGSVVYAERVQETDHESSGSVSVEAPVNYVWPWHEGKFTMLGLTVDTWGAHLQGPDGRYLSRSEFFQVLKPGMQARVSGARYYAPRRTLYDAQQISIRPADDSSGAWSD